MPPSLRVSILDIAHAGADQILGFIPDIFDPFSEPFIFHGNPADLIGLLCQIDTEAFFLFQNSHELKPGVADLVNTDLQVPIALILIVYLALFVYERILEFFQTLKNEIWSHKVVVLQKISLLVPAPKSPLQKPMIPFFFLNETKNAKMLPVPEFLAQNNHQDFFFFVVNRTLDIFLRFLPVLLI
jgi:hypothetical protein